MLRGPDRLKAGTNWSDKAEKAGERRWVEARE